MLSSVDFLLVPIYIADTHAWAEASVVDGDFNGKRFVTAKLCLIVVLALHDNLAHIFTITLFIIDGK